MRHFVVVFVVILASLSTSVKFHAKAQKVPLIYDLKNGPSLYADFIKKHKRTFQDREEYQSRYMNFLNTLKKVNEINAVPGSQKVFPNKYADFTNDERIALTEKEQKVDPELASMLRDERNPRVEDMFVVV